VRANRHSVAADRSVRDGPLAERLRETGLSAAIASPVWVQGHLAAVLVAGTRNDVRFSPEDLEAFELLALHAGREARARYTGGFDDRHLDLSLRFHAKRFRKEVYGCLARAVHAGADHRKIAVDGREIDDVSAPLRDHDVVYRDDAVEHALDVDVDDAVPLVDLERVHRRHRHDARVVEDHVDAAELVLCEGGEGVHVGAVRDVELAELGDAAFRADLRRDLLEAVRAALAATLQLDAGQVSVKAKTNEGMDAIGRGEAIAAHAVAVLLVGESA